MGIQPKPRKGENEYRWNWDAPLLISPHSPTRLYFAANKVFRSDDRGNTWQVISDDLTQQIDRNKLEVMGKIWPMDAVAKNASTSQYGAIVALDESPVEEDLIYAGTDDGLIQVTEDGGANWTKIKTFSGVPERTYVNDIIASRHDRNTVYAAFNNHKNGDFKPYILKSTDLGRSWTSISSNLPERGSVYALEEDHINGDLLFAGTEFGLQKLQVLLFGDSTKNRLDMDTQPGIARRISAAINEPRNSTSAPTRTQLDAYQIVEEEFAPIYEELQKILFMAVKNIENQLNDIGAPFTPGRLPDWRK